MPARNTLWSGASAMQSCPNAARWIRSPTRANLASIANKSAPLPNSTSSEKRKYRLHWPIGVGKSGLASGILLKAIDAHALSLFDTEHSNGEDRWITLGIDQAGRLLVVCHTFQEISKVRAINTPFSARKATRGERRSYEKHNV